MAKHRSKVKSDSRLNEAKLEQLSICTCGFPTLHETIPLGTVYAVDNDRLLDLVMICGGCRQSIPFVGVWTEHRDGTGGGYLPRQIFEVSS